MVCSAVLNAALMPLPEAALLLQACTVSMTHDTLSIAVNVPARCTHAHAVHHGRKTQESACYHASLPALFAPIGKGRLMRAYWSTWQGCCSSRKRDVTLVVGSKSREKVVHVQGITPEEALTRLRAASDADVLVQSVLPSR